MWLYGLRAQDPGKQNNNKILENEMKEFYADTGVLNKKQINKNKTLPPHNTKFTAAREGNKHALV